MRKTSTRVAPIDRAEVVAVLEIKAAIGDDEDSVRPPRAAKED